MEILEKLHIKLKINRHEAVWRLGEAIPGAFSGGGCWPVDTPGGRFYAEWETEAPVTREGQLIFFFQFLQAGERWREFMSGCPLSHTGNRRSGVQPDQGQPDRTVLQLVEAPRVLLRREPSPRFWD